MVAGIAQILSIAARVVPGLLAGATLGGNLTPIIGALANITAGHLRARMAYHWFLDSQFMRIGVPFTLSGRMDGIRVDLTAGILSGQAMASCLYNELWGIGFHRPQRWTCPLDRSQSKCPDPRTDPGICR